MNTAEMSVMERLKEIKETRGLTNQQITDMTGVPIGTVGRLFSGEVVDPKITTIIQLAQGLGVDMNLLCGMATIEPGNIPPAPVARTVEAIQFDKLLEQSAERLAEMKTNYEARIADLKRDKRALFITAAILMASILALFTADLMIPTAGWFQRSVAYMENFLKAL